MNSTYREYIVHPLLPSGEVSVMMLGNVSSKAMSLVGQCPDGQPWSVDFRNRAACLLWLCQTVPDAAMYASDGGVSVCAGSVLELAKRAGVACKCGSIVKVRGGRCGACRVPATEGECLFALIGGGA